MDVALLKDTLYGGEQAGGWFARCSLSDVRRARSNLLGVARHGVPLDLLAEVCNQLEKWLPASADADMALHNLERFFDAARNPLALAAFFQRDSQALPTLLQIFSTSQHLSDLLAVDPEAFDLLRLSEGRPTSRQVLVDELCAEVAALEHEATVLRALRRFKRRETLRIAYGDIVRRQSLRTVTMQISFLADAILEAALLAARRKLQASWGTPRLADGRPARFGVLALGKLGGLELNYSSDIDLVFLCENGGRTDRPRSLANLEFFEMLAREIVRLLTEKTAWGGVYRVDLRLRPEGSRGPMVMDVGDALRYYDTRGRTWERQAYIKARPVAGDLSLGEEFLQTLSCWVYRRYLSHADISGIKALKRRIEQLSQSGGARDVKTGRGGIRDIEFVIQFLQLLNGGDLPQLRTGNTLEAIAQLEQVGCLTNQERSILEENYTFLRQIEHRLQIMFDLQTHLLPEGHSELRKLALRMGYTESEKRSALEAFLADYRNQTEVNRKILDHLLHDAFSEDRQTRAEVDLVLDPDPSAERIEATLGKYRFRNPHQAYRNLMSLGEERLRFLSTRRCRHFLASIAPQLLQAITDTPDPDSTLVNLDKVSDSLGGKGVLWELFSFNPPSLQLYVKLCAYSPFLSEILTGNPGMIDSLMDSLVLDRLPTREAMHRKLEELCHAAEDYGPILLSFKHDQQLCVGVRDLLGKEDIGATTGALSDLAEVCLEQIVRREWRRLVARFGRPRLKDGRPCEMVILALGKFGGREMNYHSDLDIVFLYEGEGSTAADDSATAVETTHNQHFFSELGRRIINAAARQTSHGRLYAIDMRLRPTGRSGLLATSFEEFLRYFQKGSGQLWERLALCKARVVYGLLAVASSADELIAQAAFVHPWQPTDLLEIRRMRQRLEETAGTRGDLKRGPGGLVDIEFLVQMLQLRHAAQTPHLRTPNTLEALSRLYEAGVLKKSDYEFFSRAYRFLRTVEGRLRLVSTTARDRLPQDPLELTKLARLLNYSDGASLLDDYQRTSSEVRTRFERFFSGAGEK